MGRKLRCVGRFEEGRGTRNAHLAKRGSQFPASSYTASLQISFILIQLFPRGSCPQFLASSPFLPQKTKPILAIKSIIFEYLVRRAMGGEGSTSDRETEAAFPLFFSTGDRSRAAMPHTC